jgi:2-dehydro-3-deoxygluconokinase
MSVATFGEIMLRLKSLGQERLFQSPMLEATFGGSEANVAVALSRLGVSARFISILPENQIGKECMRELLSHGVDVSSIKLKKGRIGIYFFENGANQRSSNVIYDRENSTLSKISSEDIDWAVAFAGLTWFHVSGITPAVSKDCAEETIRAVRTAKEKGLTISLDLNYRAKLWNYGADARIVMSEIAQYADVLIGNEEDYQKSLGIEGPSAIGKEIDVDAYQTMCERALSRFPNAKMAAVTLRESFSADCNDWSGILVTRGQRFVSRKYHIADIVDRVGAGDSFSAGLIYGLLTLKDPRAALEYAVALSCLKHSIPGDFALIEKGEVEKLLGGDSSGRVQR